MMYSTTLMLTSAVMAVGGSLAFALSDGQVPLLTFIIPILFYAHPIQPAFILICLGLLGFGFVAPHQPISLSISLWMLVPVMVLITGQKRNWQVSILVLSVVFAMECGVLALQGDQKIDGEPYYTLLQLMFVLMVWTGTYFWKPVSKPMLWPILLIGLIFISGSLYAVLFTIAMSVLVFCLQEIRLKNKDETKGEKLSVILPALSFATIIVFPQFTVPNAIFVAWLLSLTITWLGDYLINAEITEE